jgi:hypothetical protein
LGELFEGDSADMCAVKFLLVSRGGRAEGLACADPGAWIPIGASGNFLLSLCNPINNLPEGVYLELLYFAWAVPQPLLPDSAPTGN